MEKPGIVINFHKKVVNKYQILEYFFQNNNKYENFYTTFFEIKKKIY